MSEKVEESYGYQHMAATGTLTKMAQGVLGGFMCSVSGTLALAETVSGAVILESTPVTAGVFIPLPFLFGPNIGVTATLGGGATGTFALN